MASFINRGAYNDPSMPGRIISAHPVRSNLSQRRFEHAKTSNGAHQRRVTQKKKLKNKMILPQNGYYDCLPRPAGSLGVSETTLGQITSNGASLAEI